MRKKLLVLEGIAGFVLLRGLWLAGQYRATRILPLDRISHVREFCGMGSRARRRTHPAYNLRHNVKNRWKTPKLNKFM